MKIRRASDRGHADHGWLRTYHTFSFGHYHDPRHMGFRDLRVINEDFVAPGTGFPTHGHRDMEILTYVLEGAIEHRDSMGNSFVVPAGDVQRMTAGTGVEHSEHNASKSELLHMLQIWILPERSGLPPSYEQKSTGKGGRRDGFQLLASPDGRDGSVSIHQDATLYASSLESGESARHFLPRGRHAWIQVASGGVRVNGELLDSGDGAAISEEGDIEMDATTSSEVLLFELS